MPSAKVVVQFVDANVGGRQGSTCLVNAYRPHFRVGDEDYLGVAFSGDDSSEPMQPGTCVSAEVAFVYAPEVDYSTLSAAVQLALWVWKTPDNGTRISSTLDTWLQDCNDQNKVWIALHREGVPFSESAEIVQRVA